MDNKQIKVLLIEENPEDIQLIQKLLDDMHSSFELRFAERLAAGLKQLKNECVDVVLLNPYLPDCNGIETFLNVRDKIPETPILLLTDSNDKSFASITLQKGAQDFLIKTEMDSIHIDRSIRYAIDRQQMLVELRHTTLIDELTSLYNRRGFFTLSKQQLNIFDRLSEKQRMFVFFADLDNLKIINDSFGHKEGDQALKDAANILIKTFRDSDIIARMGGDEFAVSAISTQNTNEKIITDRFQKNLEDFNFSKKRRFILSISIGITQYDPEYPRSINDLLLKADALMYDQKRRKKELKNQYQTEPS